MPDHSDPGRIAELYGQVWQGRAEVDDEVFRQVFEEALDAVEGAGIPYVLTGSVISASAGRPRRTRDIDFFVKPADAHDTLQCLEAAGFATEEADPLWLFKAVKEGVLVDVLFRASGDVILDDEMLARATRREVEGRQVPAIAVEDLVFINILAHGEDTAHYWFDALSLLSSTEIDWEYLVERASRRGARRTLSLLLYAQSVDIVVPNRAIDELYEAIFSAPEAT